MPYFGPFWPQQLEMLSESSTISSDGLITFSRSFRFGSTVTPNPTREDDISVPLFHGTFSHRHYVSSNNQNNQNNQVPHLLMNSLLGFSAGPHQTKGRTKRPRCFEWYQITGDTARHQSKRRQNHIKMPESKQCNYGIRKEKFITQPKIQR